MFGTSVVAPRPKKETRDREKNQGAPEFLVHTFPFERKSLQFYGNRFSPDYLKKKENLTVLRVYTVVNYTKYNLILLPNII